MKKAHKIFIAIAIIVLGAFSVSIYGKNIRLEEHIKSTDARAVNYAEGSCHDSEPGYELGKNGCLMEHALASGTPEICGMITSNLRFDCFRQVAGIRNDVSVCESIVAFDGAKQEEFEGLNDPNMTASMEKAACYHDLAFKNKDANTCKNIEDVDTRSQCQKCVSGKSPETEWACGPLSLLPEHL